MNDQAGLEALSEKNSGSRPSSSPGRTSCRARLYGPLRGSMRLPSVFRRSPDCGPDCWSVPAGRPATWLREIGLYDEFEAVFGSPHGEAALRRMLHATFKLWDRGWPLVAFTLRTRRIDKDLGAQLAEVDTMRRTHLWVICRRLDAEGRLRTPGAGAPAADLAFALSTPTVFEELVHVRGWPADQAADTIAGIVVAAIVDPATPSVTDPRRIGGGSRARSSGTGHRSGFRPMDRGCCASQPSGEMVGIRGVAGGLVILALSSTRSGAVDPSAPRTHGSARPVRSPAIPRRLRPQVRQTGRRLPGQLRHHRSTGGRSKPLVEPLARDAESRGW